MSNSVIDKFLKTREKNINEMAQQSNPGKGAGRYKGSNEMDLCGDKNLGSTMGVFIADKNEAPYRVIQGFRQFRINKDVADRYGIKDFRLRICNPDEYLNATDSEKELISKIIKKLEAVEKNWEAWEGKVAKYKPTYSETLTIQYMKVLQKLDQYNNPVTVDPGVKVLMSRSKAYFRAFDSFTSSNNVATGGWEFLSDLLSRDVRDRNVKYVIKVTRQQFYNFAIASVPAKTQLTDDDLNTAGDLNTEVVDITRVDVDTLNKWNKMFNEEYQNIKNGVEKDSIPPAPPVEPEPVVETAPVAPNATAQAPVPAPAEEDIDPFS